MIIIMQEIHGHDFERCCFCTEMLEILCEDPLYDAIGLMVQQKLTSPMMALSTDRICITGSMQTLTEDKSSRSLE